MSESVIEQIAKIRRVLEPRLKDVERPTFEIRPTVSLPRQRHGDIEVHLNGRLFSFTSERFAKIEAQGIVQDFITTMLDSFLRSRKGTLATESLTFSAENVLREVYFALYSVLEEVLSAEELDQIDERIDLKLKSLFGFTVVPEPLPPAALKAASGCLRETMVELMATKNKSRTHEDEWLKTHLPSLPKTPPTSTKRTASTAKRI